MFLPPCAIEDVITRFYNLMKCLLLTDPLPVPMSSLATSGATLSAARPVMPANIAIRGLSNSFIRKSTNLPNVTIYKTPAIVPEVHSAHLLMLNVSLSFVHDFHCDLTSERPNQDFLVRPNRTRTRTKSTEPEPNPNRTS